MIDKKQKTSKQSGAPVIQTLLEHLQQMLQNGFYDTFLLNITIRMKLMLFWGFYDTFLLQQILQNFQNGEQTTRG